MQGRIQQCCEFRNSGPTSTGRLEKLAVDVGRWRQRATINTCSAYQWMTYSILQVIASTLIYCCRCTHVGFVNSPTLAAPWIACKRAFIQDLPHGEPSTTASAIDSLAQNLASWLAPSYLFRWTMLQFMIQWIINDSINHSMEHYGRVLDTMPVNAAFQIALSNDILAKHKELWSEVRFCISWTIKFTTNRR